LTVIKDGGDGVAHIPSSASVAVIGFTADDLDLRSSHSTSLRAEASWYKRFNSGIGIRTEGSSNAEDVINNNKCLYRAGPPFWSWKYYPVPNESIDLGVRNKADIQNPKQLQAHGNTDVVIFP